jgi:uncharacterized membrane protein
MVTELQQAKRPVSRLAGPYGHPFHPVLVTVPIGAWVASFVFDLASRWSDEPLVFAKGAWWLIGLGVVGALVAATFGFLDLVAIPMGTKAFRTGLLHMALNLVVVCAFGGSFLLRQGRLEEPDGVATWLIALSAVAGSPTATGSASPTKPPRPPRSSPVTVRTGADGDHPPARRV